MTPSHLIALISICGVAAGAPLAARTPYPPTSWSTAFTLVANVTDMSKDLSPSVQHFSLHGVHVGAGLNAATLVRDGGNILYQNATGVASDAGVFPSGMTLTPLDKMQPPRLHYVGLNYGDAQPGVGIYPPESQAWPALYAPLSGTFAACFEPDPVYGRPQNPVRFIASQVVDGKASIEVPDGCAPVALLAQCATLGDVPAGAYYDHAHVQKVRCYENVASIDWS